MAFNSYPTSNKVIIPWKLSLLRIHPCEKKQQIRFSYLHNISQLNLITTHLIMIPAYIPKSSCSIFLHWRRCRYHVISFSLSCLVLSLLQLALEKENQNINQSRSIYLARSLATYLGTYHKISTMNVSLDLEIHRYTDMKM